MKLKLATLAVLAVSGGAASVALADHGHGHGDAARCQGVQLRGTLAAGSLSVVVAKANRNGPAAGSTVSVAVPAGTRAEVAACVTGTGTTAAYTLRGAELHFKAPKPTTTATTP